jgi:RNA polymerase sigma factor (sigma-70 family)
LSLSKEDKERIFNESFMPHANALHNFAYKLTFDEDEAKDLLQDTLLKAFRFFDYYQQGTNAKAWLFRILKNTFINEYRKKSKAPNTIDYVEVQEYLNDSNITVDLRNDTVQKALGDEVVMAINTLPVDFRTVIILCDLEDFTYEEMAGILDIPVGTVRSRLHRARNMLKEQLIDYATKKGYSIKK